VRVCKVGVSSREVVRGEEGGRGCQYWMRKLEGDVQRGSGSEGAGWGEELDGADITFGARRRARLWLAPDWL